MLSHLHLIAYVSAIVTHPGAIAPNVSDAWANAFVYECL